MNITLRNFIEVFQKTFNQLDNVLEGHSLEVAYVLLKFLQECGRYSRDEIIDICTITVMHDIGAYKTDYGRDLNGIEEHSSNNHAIYGYLFIRDFSPLSHLAEIVLYHHLDYKHLNNLKCDFVYEVKLLNLIDKINIFFRTYGNFTLDKLYYFSNDDFIKGQIEIFKKIDEREGIISKIRNGKYYDEIMEFFEYRVLTEAEAISYAKMITYAIDFRSENTVYHTIAVESLSEIIANKLNIDSKEVEVIKAAALLHDIGKIVTPLEILEKPDKLTEEEMTIMKKHVEVTYEILSEIGLDKIRDISALHHEKLDGSGYPFGLKKDNLSLPVRIVAVSDILSALIGKRSYKESLAKEEIIRILKDMSVEKIDSDIVDIVIQNYDDMMDTLFENCKDALNLYSNINKNYKYIQSLFFDKYK